MHGRSALGSGIEIRHLEPPLHDVFDENIDIAFGWGCETPGVIGCPHPNRSKDLFIFPQAPGFLGFKNLNPYLFREPAGLQFFQLD